MIKLTLTISYLFSLVVCFGQKHHALEKDTAIFRHAPLYILQLPLSNPIEASGILIKQEDIDSINVYHDDSTKREYGAKAANGLIVFIAKKTIKVLTMNQLLSDNKIGDSNLPIFIDSVIAYNPGKYIFDKKMIKSVTIETEEGTGTKYISILTLLPIHWRKEDEIYIR